MRKCDKCPEESIIHIQYSGANLCKKHFAEYVERRVQKEIRLQGKLPARAKLAIAVSGGKDSMSMLHILNRVFASHRDVELIALIVDEGLAGYRERAIKLATDFSEKLGIRHEVLSFQESFGVRPDDIAALGEEWRPCTYCGVLRRNLLNRRARELGLTLKIPRTAAVGSATARRLTDQGVDASRLEAVGYGETKPLVSNDTERGRSRNRRVEFTILEVNGHALPTPTPTLPLLSPTTNGQGPE